MNTVNFFFNKRKKEKEVFVTRVNNSQYVRQLCSIFFILNVILPLSLLLNFISIFLLTFSKNECIWFAPSGRIVFVIILKLGCTNKPWESRDFVNRKLLFQCITSINPNSNKYITNQKKRKKKNPNLFCVFFSPLRVEIRQYLTRHLFN